MNYKQAGVDVGLGDTFVEKIKSRTKTLISDGILSGIGPFAGLFDFKSEMWTDPVIVSCTDGVGTKLKLAFEMDRHNTVGIDLVAMSINDLIVCGAKPLFFLDYLATGKLDLTTHLAVIDGIVEGCRQSRCALLGGETAEMPGMYLPGEYDLAGFAVGMVERGRILNPQMVKSGDILLGLASTGFHSNGYSLVRKVFMDRSRFPLDQAIEGDSRPLGEILLAPTRIYLPEVQAALRVPGVKSFAHITGGGITGNLPRAFPEHLGAEINRGSWPIPPVMALLQKETQLDASEMFQTFNMGLGLIAVCNPGDASAIRESLKSAGFDPYQIGRIVSKPGIHYLDFDSKRHYQNDAQAVALEEKSAPCCLKKVKIAVLGSGRGSNLDALIQSINAGDLDAEIACVISNNSQAGILNIARSHSIPAFHISSFTHPTLDEYDSALNQIMNNHNVEMICLAGYMKKLTPTFLSLFNRPILNIHPALLPAFGGEGMFGMRVHCAVIESGAKFSGATVHLVDPIYDHGHILAQDIVKISEDETPESLAAKVLSVEHRLYRRAIQDWIRLMHV